MTISLGIRRTLARWLDPETALAAKKHWYLQSRIGEGHRWLGEFPDIEAFIEWLWEGEAGHFRSLSDAATKSKWRWQIPDFREQLRARSKKQPSAAPATGANKEHAP